MYINVKIYSIDYAQNVITKTVNIAPSKRHMYTFAPVAAEYLSTKF